MSPRTFRRAVLACGAMLTAAAAWLVAHEGHAPLPTRGARVDANGVVLSAESRDALDVRTAEAEAGSVEDGPLAYAALVARWNGRAFASSRLGGRVARLHASAGQEVAAGDLLAEVDSPELAALQADALQADAARNVSAKALADLEAARGAISEQAILEGRVRLRQDENALAVTRARWLGIGLPAADFDALLKAGSASARTLPVRSPLAGTLAHADLAVGKVVEPLEHLFEVADTSTVWAKIGVLERDAGRVALGQAVELRLNAYPGETFRGNLAAVGPALEPSTNLLDAVAELRNPPGAEPRLLPGMAGDARVLPPATPGRVTVPAEAVIDDGSGAYVLMEEAATAGASEYRRRAVVVGRRVGGRTELTAGGVLPGDRVVTRGAHELAGFFVSGVVRPGPEAAAAMGLSVERAGLSAVEDVVEIDGTVDLPPDRRASASAALAGTILSVRANLGQVVEAGDVLAEVFSPAFLDLQLELLRVHLDTTLADETLARLRAAGSAVPRRRLLEAEGQADAARHKADAARRKLSAAGLLAGDIDRLLTSARPLPALPVRSPIAGRVASFDAELGQSVRAETPLFAVHDGSRPLIRGHVPEREVGRVRPGRSVRVRLSADPSFLATGTIVRSGREVGADSRTLSVWVELAEPPTTPLRHGQLARLAVTTGSETTTLAVPPTAVVSEGTRSFVFVRRDDGSFDRREVVLGRADDRLVEVLSGLSVGDPVAVRGAAGLRAAFAVVR